MEVNADQVILVHCKILFFIVLQDFPINCSKPLTLLFELRLFFPQQVVLACRKVIIHLQGWGGQ